MSALRTILSIVTFFAVLASSAVAMENLTQRQQEILKTALSADGWLTEEMHTEFWTQGEVANWHENPEVVGAFRRLMERVAVAGMAYQREGWESALLSLRAGRVVESEGFPSSQSKVFAMMEGIGGNSAQRQALYDKMDKLLLAAATKQPMQSPNGPLYITEDLIKQVLSGLDGSLARFEKLADVKWDPTPKEFVYEDAHFKILNLFPFARATEDLGVSNGKNLKITTYTAALEAETYLTVGFTDLGSNFVDPASGVRKSAEGALKGMGLRDHSPVITSKWRGYDVAVGGGEVVVNGIIVGGSVRVVYLPRQKGLLSIVAVSDQGILDANFVRETSEATVQLLD